MQPVHWLAIIEQATTQEHKQLVMIEHDERNE
jgi:hypothetical protein